ncbi:flagellar biosynthetic protein FliO [Erythrobacter sp. HA6-11]
MLWYFAKLAFVLPLLALLIWGSLKLTRHMQNRLAQSGSSERAIKLVETSFLAPGIRLAVVEFHGREILLGCSKQGLTRLAEVEAREAKAAAPQALEQMR